MRPSAAALLVLVLAGPARGGALATVGRVAWAPFRYVGGRVADLFEVVDLNLGFGPGAKIDARYAVNFLGAGRVESVRLGLDHGRLRGWREADRQMGLFPLSLLGWPAAAAGRVLRNPELTEKAIELAVAGSAGSQTLERAELAREGAPVLISVVSMWRHATWGDSLPVGAEAHAGLVGARVLVKPLQLVDLAVGFVGLDLDPWLAKRPF